MRGRLLLGQVSLWLGLCLGCAGPSDGPAIGGTVDLSADLPAAAGLNYLVVSFDALRADSLGVYGNPRGLTPHLDAAARDAVVFDDAYAAAQATPASFASAFTGMWPFKVFQEWKLVEERTLHALFREGGYEAAAIAPSLQLDLAGFDDRIPVELMPLQTRDERTLEAARTWLSEHGDRPFLLWVHFHSPHMPYYYLEMAERLYSEPDAGLYRPLEGLNPIETDFGALSPDDRRRLRELYDGEVYYADFMFGELMRHLEALGLTESTVLAITADHGEEFGDHGRYVHWQLYDEVVRAPLIVRHPAGSAGRRVQVPVGNVDLLPTLAALAGLPVRGGLDGVALNGRLDDGRPIFVTQMTEPAFKSVAVRRGRWKMILWCDRETESRLELFDMEADPGETANLAQGQRQEVRELHGLLRDGYGGNPCAVIDSVVRGVELAEGADDETKDALRTLGYLD